MDNNKYCSFEAGARFANHQHHLGEEVFVLDGVFSDDNRDYPRVL